MSSLGDSAASTDFSEFLAKYPETKPHGFCVGCAVVCHDGHDLIDLGQRLSFRCDCGNGRMPSAC
jgi:hypothetical protein